MSDSITVAPIQNLISSNDHLTMSSREIVELCEKRRNQ